MQRYLERNHASLLPKLKFIKMDAEGYDFTVLKSMADLLESQRPFIKAEVFKRTNCDQRQELFSFLKSLHYSVFRVLNDGNYHGVKLEKKDLINWQHYDMFCVPD